MIKEFLTICLVGVLILAIPGLWIFGTVKSFQSHPITGIFVVLVEPMPLIVGGFELFDYPLADKITEFHQELIH